MIKHMLWHEIFNKILYHLASLIFEVTSKMIYSSAHARFKVYGLLQPNALLIKIEFIPTINK